MVLRNRLVTRVSSTLGSGQSDSAVSRTRRQQDRAGPCSPKKRRPRERGLPEPSEVDRQRQPFGTQPPFTHTPPPIDVNGSGMVHPPASEIGTQPPLTQVPPPTDAN